MDWRKRNTTARPRFSKKGVGSFARWNSLTALVRRELTTPFLGQSPARRLAACLSLMLAAGCAGVVGHKHGERPDCVCFPRGACAGYYSTCWRLWPEECASCPVSGGPVVPGASLLTPGPYTAPGEPAMPANGGGPGELITPPEPPKIRAPLLPPDATGSRTGSAVRSRARLARVPAPSPTRPTTVPLSTAAPEQPKPAAKPNPPSRPVIKSFSVPPAKDVASAEMKTATAAPANNSVATPIKSIATAPSGRMALDAPAVPTAWEERIAQNTSAAAAQPSATTPSRPIVAAAPRRQSTTVVPHTAATHDQFSRTAARQPTPPVRSTLAASRPTVNSPSPVRSRGYDERRVVTATRPGASNALAELWSSSSPRQTYRSGEVPDERTDLRIVSEVKPLPPVQPRPVVQPVEMRHDLIVVRGDQIEKLPAIKTAPPVRAPIRLADGPPVVRPALRR